MSKPVGSGLNAIRKIRTASLAKKNEEELELDHQVDMITAETLNYMNNGDITAFDRAQMRFIEYLAGSQNEDKE